MWQRTRDQVPAAFASTVTLEAHRRGADYTLPRAASVCWPPPSARWCCWAWTLLGGLDALNQALLSTVQPRVGKHGLPAVTAGCLCADRQVCWTALSSSTSTFRIEQRFGFQPHDPKLCHRRSVEKHGRRCLIGLPLAALILWIMGAAGKAVVAVGLGRVDGLQPGAAGAVPDGDRSAVQQVRGRWRTSP